jgi:amino acid adenylation domain-containing protein
MIEHYSLVNRLNWMQKKYRLDTNDTILQKTPFTFDVSLWELFWWAIAGARVCLLIPRGEKAPREIVNAIQKNHIAMMHFVPSMLKVFLEFIKDSGEIGKLSSLKRVIASGEALTVSLVKLFNDTLWKSNHTGLSNLYGPTEATVDVSFFDCPVEGPLATIPIGKPIDNIKLYILDRYLNLQPVGVTGELGIAGDGVARGYLNRQELTAEKFCLRRPGGSFCKNRPLDRETSAKNFLLEGTMGLAPLLYRTGDLACWLPDGNVEFLGRIDHQVKIRGFRIELGEIEIQLLKHEKIKEAVVLPGEPPGRNTGIQGEKPGQFLSAYIVSEGEFTIPALKEYLSKELPGYMIPSHFVRVEKIPLTPNGKVDRKALPGVGAQISTGVKFAPPRNDIEEKIANIWKEVLQLNRVGIHENFFDLGGTSLDVIRVNMKLKECFNENEAVMLMFRYTTISSFARYLDQKAGKTKEPGQVVEKTVHIDKIKRSRANQRSKRRG